MHCSISAPKFNSGIPANTVSPQTPKQQTYFEGLDALRFIAAMLVVFSHIYLGQVHADLPHLPAWPVLLNGRPAVQLFFCLSGFLITYLLLHENQNGTISVKKFYVRRILRIWPVYYIVVTFGLLFYGVLLPHIIPDYAGTDYETIHAAILYGAFLPNVMLAFYHVGGILGVTWSVGVEEQFYIVWAPLLKRFKHNIPALLGSGWLVITSLQIANYHNYFGVSNELKSFIYGLQFNFMLTGAIGAYLYFKRRENLLQHLVFRSKPVQALIYSGLFAYFLVFANGALSGLQFLSLPVAFTWLIINTGANPNCLLPLKSRRLNQLGAISYGIYMYHFIVVYLVSFGAQQLHLGSIPDIGFIALFHCAVIVLSIVVAQLSYALIERRFIRLKDKFQT